MLGVKLNDSRIDNIDLGEKLLQESQAIKARKNKQHSQAHDLFEQPKEIYRNLRKASEHQAFELAGNFAKELRMRHAQYPKGSTKQVLHFIDMLCGYKEKPEM